MRKQVYRHEGTRPNLPYSPVVRAGDVLFVSGHVPLDPTTHQVVGDDIATQTQVTFENLKASLALAGASLDDVVKVNIFLRRMEDFGEMNRVYCEYFPKDPPARTTVGTTALSHPQMRIEVELTALAPSNERS